ncbi:phosphopantetheine-binding protein [Actinoplanes sp. KI2]|uniref:acyl carrier protein n=1 Tax=Actinoplanes sp. KI2 TaxID=2983315 RepID=UPI0021D57601|nr:acyl carrier protein [Actinoplanes sp. KI2]MCU7725970.1 phosphopantetheine-binding protein [Actinoplanes sp. KI2]
MTTRPTITEGLKSAWVEILGVDDVSGDSNFFHLGGDSLSALRLLAGLRSSGHAIPQLVDVLATPIFEDQVKLFEQQADPPPRPSPDRATPA